MQLVAGAFDPPQVHTMQPRAVPVCLLLQTTAWVPFDLPAMPVA